LRKVFRARPNARQLTSRNKIIESLLCRISVAQSQAF